MKVAVIGSRTFDNYTLLKTVLDSAKEKIVAIVSGGAKGADTLGAQWADENGKEKILFLPDWDKYGKGAAFRRNIQIVQECDKMIVFWDGKSKGTMHSIDQALRLNKPYRVVMYNNL